MSKSKAQWCIISVLAGYILCSLGTGRAAQSGRQTGGPPRSAGALGPQGSRPGLGPIAGSPPAWRGGSGLFGAAGTLRGGAR